MAQAGRACAVPVAWSACCVFLPSPRYAIASLNQLTPAQTRPAHPKGTDLSRYTEGELDAVAHTLNSRPRKALDWVTPAEALDKLLSTPPVASSVATTPGT